jgi:PadR family transcriptional regulator PadR
VEESTAIIDKWRSQSRKGFLDLCVLVLLERGGRSYGLDMMESLTASGLEVSEGTLYPLLARMTREGSLEASWTTPETGHPRKYYSLSGRGAEALASMKAEFEEEIAAYRRLGEEQKR